MFPSHDQRYNNVYFDALKRRVNTWIIMPEMNKTLHFTDWDDAEKHFI